MVDYDDGVLRDALHRLERRGYTRLASGAGSRAPKYRHLLADALPLPDDEQALLCVLMLRGAQTPGELKQRADRLHPFGGLDEVHQGLARLIERGLVQVLERRPGQKEERYRQLLGEGAEDASEPVPRAAPWAPQRSVCPRWRLPARPASRSESHASSARSPSCERW